MAKTQQVHALTGQRRTKSCWAIRHPRAVSAKTLDKRAKAELAKAADLEARHAHQVLLDATELAEEVGHVLVLARHYLELARKWMFLAAGTRNGKQLRDNATYVCQSTRRPHSSYSQKRSARASRPRPSLTDWSSRRSARTTRSQSRSSPTSALARARRRTVCGGAAHRRLEARLNRKSASQLVRRREGQGATIDAPHTDARERQQPRGRACAGSPRRAPVPDDRVRVGATVRDGRGQSRSAARDDRHMQCVRTRIAQASRAGAAELATAEPAAAPAAAAQQPAVHASRPVLATSPAPGGQAHRRGEPPWPAD
ncbi:hypothetical protein T492DRAFT_1117086 [Pavlovales sp. CCMP2436]|nr:hypothetical protein T492DRAFT_1117086 [Pavlovales sp. CCMP2436]